MQLSLNLYEEDIKNADLIDSENMRNVINDTLPKFDENIITNKNSNNQLELENFIKDFDCERVRAIIKKTILHSYIDISKRQLKIEANQFFEVNSIVKTDDELRDAFPRAVETNYVKLVDIKLDTGLSGF